LNNTEPKKGGPEESGGKKKKDRGVETALAHFGETIKKASESWISTSRVLKKTNQSPTFMSDVAHREQSKRGPKLLGGEGGTGGGGGGKDSF